MRKREHPAARGFAHWLDRRRFEHDDPQTDGGESLGALWALWVAERVARGRGCA